MARQDSTVAIRKSRPQRRLQYLLNETYSKIDELKELIRKEASLIGSNSHDATVSRMFSRQDYLVTVCAEVCSEQDKRNLGINTSGGAHAGPSSRPSCSFATPLPTIDQSPPPPPLDMKSEKDDSKQDGSWYGSLDRSLAKKKKQQIIDKRRRHTKTIGSMAGLDVFKKTVELRPDEQYEIGLPAAPRISTTRSSIFPMTQHQYYTALMETKMGRKHGYPLDMRPVQPSSSVVPTPMSSWGFHVEGLDENKNMKKHLQQTIPVHKANVVPLPCRSLGSELAFRHSSKSSKIWYETNLDEAPLTPGGTQNPSPSPSMISSARGSSQGSVASGIDTIDGGMVRMAISSPANESNEFTSKSSESSESWSGAGNEVTKPFEMSDYYKYSTKFRSRNSPVSEEGNLHDPRPTSVLSVAASPVLHSRQPSQMRPPSFEGSGSYRDTNGNSSVGPKLPPKQRRAQNKSISGSSIIYEGDMATGDAAKEIWITNEPTFV